MKQFCWLALLLLTCSPIQANDPLAETQSAIYLGENGVIVMGFHIQVGGKSPQQSYQQFVDDLMKSVDANQDGVVSVIEAHGRYLTTKQAAQAQLIPQTEAKTPDTTPDVSPADGKISRAEFLTYFKRIGLQPFLMQFQPSAAASRSQADPGRREITPPSFPCLRGLIPTMTVNCRPMN